MTKLMRQLVPFTTFCFVLLAIIARTNACAQNASEGQRYPPSLVKAARAFKSADRSHRYAEAAKLLELMPKCPIIYSNYVGIGVHESYDFSRPSYILSSADVLYLLGEPAAYKTNSYSVSYSYRIGEHIEVPDWSLYIEFRNNRVVYSMLRGWTEPWHR
jgi:hypothetical protein